jgi:pyruvate/2-oxoglutarate dehydrogenase complex dihydrolipoamide dehydrogenase (E3) component
MSESSPTLLVLGGGPAGLTAAVQARELGARVTLLEADRVAGTSYNRGPAPLRMCWRVLGGDHANCCRVDGRGHDG